MFRPIVDYYVYLILMEMIDDEPCELNKKIKTKLIDVVNNKIIYKNKNFTILNSIPQYINDVISFISIGKNELDIPYLIDE